MGDNQALTGAPIKTLADAGGIRVEHLDRNVPKDLALELAPIVRMAEDAARAIRALTQRAVATACPVSLTSSRAASEPPS